MKIEVELTLRERLRLAWLRLRFTIREMNAAVEKLTDPRVK